MDRRKVIVLTDGDRVARRVVEKVAQNIGGRAISMSAGNPTPISGAEIAAAVKRTPYDPVLVMVDDCGKRGAGQGETALEDLSHDPEIEIIGVVAVASNTAKVEGTPIDAAVTRNQEIIDRPVDKDGNPEAGGKEVVKGDTVDVLNRVTVPVVIGIGDPGKMEDADLVENGARITTRAVEEILRRSRLT